jgi:hypothetical protein
MFQSPVYIDFPWSIGLFCTAVALAMFGGLVIFNKKRRFQELITTGLHWLLPTVPKEKWDVAGKVYFGGMALCFGSLGLFCLAIGAGVVTNKQRPELDFKKVMQQFEEEHKHLPRRHNFDFDLGK